MYLKRQLLTAITCLLAATAELARAIRILGAVTSMSMLFSIESHYENTSHLEVQCQPGVLVPNDSMEVDIVFYPRESRKYHEIIPFEVNGLSTVKVELFGEGTDMKVSYTVYLTTSVIR